MNLLAALWVYHLFQCLQPLLTLVLLPEVFLPSSPQLLLSLASPSSCFKTQRKCPLQPLFTPTPQLTSSQTRTDDPATATPVQTSLSCLKHWIGTSGLSISIPVRLPVFVQCLEYLPQWLLCKWQTGRQVGRLQASRGRGHIFFTFFFVMYL